MLETTIQRISLLCGIISIIFDNQVTDQSFGKLVQEREIRECDFFAMGVRLFIIYKYFGTVRS